MAGHNGDQLMKRFLVPSLLALGLASVALPASAVEGTLDGVVYSLPEDTGFFTPADLITEPENLQSVVDEQRRVIPFDGSMIEFMSTPLTADAAKRGQSVVLVRESAPQSEGRIAIMNASKGVTFENGVAKVDVAKLKEPAPGMRAYVVQTGLGFAPEVVATCQHDKFAKGERCSIQLPRPERRKLAWTGVQLTEFDPKVMRLEIVDLIEKTLPVEADRFRKGEPIPAPTIPDIALASALGGMLDGVVYAAPAGSVFRGKDSNLVKDTDLQASVDALRKDVGPDKRLTLFTTYPIPSAGQPREAILEVIRLPNPVIEASRFPVGTCEGIKAHADVKCLDMAAVKDDEVLPGVRGFRVSTGLPFAKEAYVQCVDDFDDKDCEVQVLRPNDILMEWTRVSLNDTDAGSVRARVRKLISDALPQEAAKAR